MTLLQPAPSRPGLEERIDRSEVPSSDWSRLVTERPLTALVVAAGAGFIVGGGARSRLGLAMLGIAARIGIRQATVNFIKQVTNHERAGRNSPDR